MDSHPNLELSQGRQQKGQTLLFSFRERGERGKLRPWAHRDLPQITQLVSDQKDSLAVLIPMW